MEDWHLSNGSFWEGGSSPQSLNVQWSPQKPHFAPLHNQPMNPPPPNLSPPQFPHQNSLLNAYNEHENELYNEEGGFGNYEHEEQGGWENASYQGHGETLQGHHNYRPWNHGGFHRGYNGHQNWNNKGMQSMEAHNHQGRHQFEAPVQEFDSHFRPSIHQNVSPIVLSHPNYQGNYPRGQFNQPNSFGGNFQENYQESQGFNNHVGSSRCYNQNQRKDSTQVQVQDGLSGQVATLTSQMSELIEAVKGLTRKQEVTDNVIHALSKQVGQIAESMDVSKQEKPLYDTKLIPQHQPSSSGPQEEAPEEEAHVNDVHTLRSDKTYDNRKLMLNVFSNISKSVVEHDCFRDDMIEDTMDLITKGHAKLVSIAGELKPYWTHKVERLSDYINSIWKPPLEKPLKVELEELRDEAYECSSAYKTKTKAAHDARIKVKRFKVRQRAWSYNSKVKFFPGKLKSRWLGPFVITNIVKFGEFEIEDPASKRKQVVNGHRLKPYGSVNEECAKTVDVEEFSSTPPSYSIV